MLLYIDVANGNTFARDDEGLEFADLNEACAAVVAMLPEIAREAVHGPVRLAAMMQARERYIAAQVRDETDRVLFRTRLRLDME